MKIKNIIFIFIALVISFFAVNFENMVTKKVEKDLVYGYKVYIDGKDIGLINDKEELNKYINEKQEEIRKKYLVDNVYVPNNIDVVKDLTYSNEIEKVSDIYDKIQENNPFTIEGYEITIDRTNSEEYVNDDNVESVDKITKIYSLRKEDFEEAIKNALLSFVTLEDYEAFVNGTQTPIRETGSIIENIYIDDDIKIVKTHVSVNNKIFMDSDSIANYLVFGNSNNITTYTVNDSDTIDSIANSNHMSLNELIIANKDIRDKNTLLYAGQKLNVGLISPLFTVIVEKEVVEDQTIKYDVETKYDNSLYQGYYYIEQNGSNGQNRVTNKIKYINGEMSVVYPVSSIVLKPKINMIEVKGGRRPPIGDGNWRYPIIFRGISSRYQWRWGKMHTGIDLIAAVGTPVYATRAGTIYAIGYESGGRGQYVQIAHDNGYYSQYEHLEYDSPYRWVSMGQHVEAGQVIANSGNTGYSTGPHLHFEIWDGPPYVGNHFNPCNFIGC